MNRRSEQPTQPTQPTQPSQGPSAAPQGSAGGSGSSRGSRESNESGSRRGSEERRRSSARARARLNPASWEKDGIRFQATEYEGKWYWQLKEPNGRELAAGVADSGGCAVRAGQRALFCHGREGVLMQAGEVLIDVRATVSVSNVRTLLVLEYAEAASEHLYDPGQPRGYALLGRYLILHDCSLIAPFLAKREKLERALLSCLTVAKPGAEGSQGEPGLRGAEREGSRTAQ